MKTRIFAAALAVFTLAAIVTPPPAAALSNAPYSTSVSASVTNTTATFGFPAGHVCLYNTGANTAYFSWDAVATSTPGANVMVLPSSGPPADYTFTKDAPSTVGIITGSSTTTVLVYAFPNNGSAATCPASPANTYPASPTFSGTLTVTTNIVDSATTASRLVATDGSKNFVSNGAITTNALAKSASSGASLSASALSDDGTNVTTTEPIITSGANGAQVSCGWSAMENLTLNTGGTTTDTAGNLLPANSLILAVVGRVTTTITAACTGWSLGDATTAARFTSNDVTLTANETQVGQNQMAGGVSTNAAGPVQAAAAKVRVTCAGGNPGAGVVRIQVYSCTYTGPTS